jgi:hypothetical protein
MSEDIQQDAAELAKRSRSQAKNSAKNAGRAVKAVAEPVVDATAEEIHDTAQKLEGTAEDAMQAARKFDMRALTRLSSDTGQGFIALSVALWAGSIAFNKFRAVKTGGSNVLQSSATE